MKNYTIKLRTLGIMLGLSLFVSAQAQETTGTEGIPDDFEGVIGGDGAEPGDFPWMVSLAMSDGNPGCGASLIHPMWVLTAGHCYIDFAGAPSIESVIINSVIVDVDALEPFSELITVEEIIPHHDYAGIFGGGTGPDMALIRLSEPAVTTPVQLATFEDADYFAGDEPAMVLGWGKTVAGGDNVDSLLLGNCIFIADDTCATMYAEAGGSSVYDANAGGNICAGYFSGDMPVGAAQGDSGGPLFFEDDEGTYKQVGIVSGGNSDITTEDFPGVFTLVPKYKEWIDSVILSHEASASIEQIEENNIVVNYSNDEGVIVTGLVETMPYTISLFTLSGTQVVEMTGESGSSTFVLNSSEYKAGMYVVQVMNQNTGNRTVRKVVII